MAFLGLNWQKLKILERHRKHKEIHLIFTNFC